MNKSTIVFFAFAMLMSNLSFGQSESKTTTVKYTNSQGQIKLHSVDIRALFPDEFKTPNAPSPEELIQLRNRMHKKEEWNFQVGDQREWYTRDRVNDVYVQIGTTCRAIGEHCYIFVQDSIWNDRVDQTAVDRVLASFEDSVPKDETMGIYEKVTLTYGNLLLDVDSDDKIIIFILDIIDGYDPSTSAGWVAGYFAPINETDPSTNLGSNGCEMIYIDAYPSTLTTESGVNDVMGTVAHEFQHMVHAGINPTQETFYNEGCSELSSIICGYIDRSVDLYFNNPNVKINDWREGTNDVYADYSRAMCFMYYIYEQFGVEFFSKFLAAKQPGSMAPLPGIPGINKALSQLTTPTTRRFQDILFDWFLANGLNDTSINPKWGYNEVISSRLNGEEFLSGNVPPNTVPLERTGAHYMTFKAGEDFSITVNYALSWYSFYTKLYAIKGPGTLNEVVELTAGTANNFPEFQNTYDELKVIFMANELTSIDPFSIGYTVSTSNSGAGLTEIKYDTDTAQGGLNLVSGDIIAVWFDGVPGGKLDSIKVGLTSAGQISGSIAKYSGTLRPTPIGASIMQNLIIDNPAGERWTKIDLRSKNISAAEKFIVALNYEGDPNPNVLAERDPDHSDYYHNASYKSGDNWYFYTHNDGGIWIYLIRAYVSWGLPTNTETIELLPNSFALNQNYPNPFNPMTSIKFALPNRAIVKLAVYDAIGQQVASLINEEMEAGYHSIMWNGTNVSSGVYFYRIEAGDFVQTKKMILLK